MTTGRRRRPAHPHPATPPDRDRTLRAIAWGYALIDAGSGSSFLLGGPAASPSLRLLHDLIPITVWASALLAAGILAVVKWHIPAYLLGVLAWSAYAVSSWIAMFDATLLGANGPWVATGLAALHFVALRFWASESRARR